MTLGRADRRYGAYLFDLDGTIYLDDRLTNGAAETIGWLRRTGARVVFVTNNPLQPGAAYAAKLTRLGIPVEPEEIVTSLDALVRYLATVPPAGPVLAIAEPLVRDVLRDAGFRITDAPDDAAMVVVSWDRTFDYPKLVAAFRAVRAGARLVATNPDPFCPTADGGLPDCAAMLAAIEASTGVRAEAVVGKPSRHMAAAILARVDVPPADAVMVGDRLLTDVGLARVAGAAAALVLTGATRREDVADAPTQPDLLLTHLTDLIPLHDPLATLEARP